MSFEPAHPMVHDMPFSLQRSAGLSEMTREINVNSLAQSYPKSSSTRRRSGARLSSLHHVLGELSLTHLDAELERSPWIRGAPHRGAGGAHPPNQITYFALHSDKSRNHKRHEREHDGNTNDPCRNSRLFADFGVFSGDRWLLLSRPV